MEGRSAIVFLCLLSASLCPPQAVPGPMAPGILPRVVKLTLLALPGSAQTVEPRYEPFAAGAATTFYPSENAAFGANNLVDLLQWKVPGLIVTRCPDGTVGIGIRTFPACGSGPLLIIDGVKISEERAPLELLTLNPFMVESVTVLRDVASTSVYGIRAAGGVILIFTRRR